MSTNWQTGAAAAPEISLSTCSGPAPARPAATRGIHSAHLAAAVLSLPEDEGAAGAGGDAEHTSRVRRLPLLRALGFAGRGSQLGAAFAAGGRRASEWRGRRWTAAAIGWSVRGAGGLDLGNEPTTEAIYPFGLPIMVFWERTAVYFSR